MPGWWRQWREHHHDLDSQRSQGTVWTTEWKEGKTNEESSTTQPTCVRWKVWKGLFWQSPDSLCGTTWIDIPCLLVSYLGGAHKHSKFSSIVMKNGDATTNVPCYVCGTVEKKSVRKVLQLLISWRHGVGCFVTSRLPLCKKKAWFVLLQACLPACQGDVNSDVTMLKQKSWQHHWMFQACFHG